MTRILIVNIDGLHHKNRRALEHSPNLLVMTATLDNWRQVDPDTFDILYFPTHIVPHLPTTPTRHVIVVGPHCSVLPTESVLLLPSHAIYIQPSQWVVDLWKSYPICQNLTMKAVPFAVNTDTFRPTNTENRNLVMVYTKHRKSKDMEFLWQFLRKWFGDNGNVRVFDYRSGYSEQEYLNVLQNSMYGIWVGCHESQGFAVQEALACNVPLLVWGVTSLAQEDGASYPAHLEATTVPYWDNRCGEVFHTSSELEPTWRKFITKLDQYQPREFVLEHLSTNVCEQVWTRKFV